MAQAEATVVLPIMLVVLAIGVWVLAAVGAQLRSTDAAGVAARAAARGDDAPAVRRAALAVAPGGAELQVTTARDTVQVLVREKVRPSGAALAVLPALEVSGRAVAGREDRVQEP